MESIRQWIPLLAPILLIEIALMIVALVDLARRERTKGPKWVWAVVIVLLNLIGPILYFVFGREE
ncbi:MAG: PLD nuclease N-terminal domain-containing protein [Anaerolineae bacterium]|jgi:hypothetical protein